MKATTTFEQESVYSWCESGRFPCSENVFDCLSILLNGLEKFCRKNCMNENHYMSARPCTIYPSVYTDMQTAFAHTQTCIVHATRAFLSRCVKHRIARQILQVFRRFEGISSNSRNALKFSAKILTHSQNPDACTHTHISVPMAMATTVAQLSFCAPLLRQRTFSVFVYLRKWYRTDIGHHAMGVRVCVWVSAAARVPARVLPTLFHLFHFYLAFSCAGHQLRRRRRRQQWPISSAKFYEWFAEWALLRWQQCMSLCIGVSNASELGD